MKKIYETAEINIFIFESRDVIVASGEDVFTPSFSQEENEMEVL